jgi:hypothetical protein
LVKITQAIKDVHITLKTDIILDLIKLDEY